MSDLTTARVTENGQSAFGVRIDVSGHVFDGDEPVSFGGGDTGPAPYDLLCAALGECTAITVRWYAKQQNWPLEKVEVVVTHRKEAVEGSARKTDVFAKTVAITGAGLSDEQKLKLIEVAGKCPVHRTMEAALVITTSC